MSFYLATYAFRVSLNSVVALMSRNFLFETGEVSEIQIQISL